jgi:hypothetical protein
MSKKLFTVSLLVLLVAVPLTARGQGATKPFSEMTDAELQAYILQVRAEGWALTAEYRMALEKHSGYILPGPRGVRVLARTFPNLVRAMLEYYGGMTPVWDAAEGEGGGGAGAKGTVLGCLNDPRTCWRVIWGLVSIPDDIHENNIRADLLERYPPEQYPDITAADIEHMVQLMSETRQKLFAERTGDLNLLGSTLIYNDCEASVESEARSKNREERRKELEHRANGIPDVGGESKILGKPFPGTGGGTWWSNGSNWDPEDRTLDDEITVCGNCPSEVTVSSPQAPTNTRLKRRGSQ